MKFVPFAIRFFAKFSMKLRQRSENGQRDEFTCVTHFPSLMAVL
jgi:hypothetical protein